MELNRTGAWEELEVNMANQKIEEIRTRIIK